ncbi:LRR receptor-like serine/threonine-protein kinase RGI5 [Gossypium raimondii]|uniref:LRR receptor-like serine/threonine-protein kinase RGI5 n=1 Tax=Gossypium raimondii TaxID=29730 RepID=UPI00227A612A|nr:LRR receptor-like serine/threonine-protein kinase RGI5 [Gossypium raimondii]
MALIILLVLIILAIADVNSSNEISSNSYSACPENEKQALLVFKEGLIDDANRLASWDPHHHPDCCTWFGVVCGNMTGHILSLNLSLPPLDDTVDIDSYLMSMLKGSDFHGPIPNFLRNMTSLRHLDLSYNNFKSSIPEWLYRFSSLQVLSLSANELQGDISSAIFNISTLNEIDLSWNDLEGKLPRAVGNLCNLRSIVLSSVRLNQDISHIFEILSGCSSHRFESLTFARKLANLEKVEIYNNLLEGVVSGKHFANHTKLRYFEGWDNSLVLRANPYRLNATIGTRVLSLANNLLSGKIPDCWIKWQSLQVLRLDGNRFTGKIPSSMGTLSELQSLHLHNRLHGEIPLSLKNCRELVAINLGKNELDDG